MGNKQLMGNIQQLFLSSITAFKSTPLKSTKYSVSYRGPTL